MAIQNKLDRPSEDIQKSFTHQGIKPEGNIPPPRGNNSQALRATGSILVEDNGTSANEK